MKRKPLTIRSEALVFLLGLLLAVGMTGVLLKGKLVYWIAPFALLGAFFAYWYSPSWSVVLLCAYWLFHEILLVFEIPMKASFWPDIIVAFFTLFWLIRTIQEKGGNVVRGLLTTAILLYLVMLLIQACYAPTLLAGFFGFKWLAMHVPLYFLASSRSMDRPRLQQFLLLLLGAGAIKALFHVGQFLLPELFPTSFSDGGAGYGAHGFMVILLMPLTVVNVSWLLTKPHPRLQAFLLAVLVCLIAGQVVSMLRAVWFSLLFALGIVAFGHGLRRAMGVLGILLALSWLVMPSTARSRFLATFLTGQGTYTAQAKLRGIGQKTLPWLTLWGQGVGSITSYGAQRRVGAESLNFLPVSPESGVANTLIEMGLVGSLVYLSVFWFAGKQTFQAFSRSRDPFSRAFHLGMFAIVCSTLLGELFVVYVYAEAFYFWYLLGLWARFAEDEKELTGKAVGDRGEVAPKQGSFFRPASRVRREVQ